MMSLQLRLLLLAVAGIAAALLAASIVLVAVFERHVRGRYVEALDGHLHQLVALVQVEPQGVVSLRHELYDAVFQEPLSGHYWQVSEGGRAVLRSKSLWDATLPVPPAPDGVVNRRIDDLQGPRSRPLIGVERMITLRAESDRTLSLVVAGERRVVDDSRREFMTTVAISLAVIGGMLALASWLQVRAGLAPLREVGHALELLRRGRRQHIDGRFPAEIADVVDALNRLLATQAAEVERARANAGKIGHGLKTPLAVLAAECRALRSRGEPEAAQTIEQLIEEMNAQVTRVIAAARSVGPRQAVGTRTRIEPLLQRMLAVMRRLPNGGGLDWQTRIEPPDATIPVDQRDLEEMIGNVLDNARKWARAQVLVTVDAKGPAFRIVVEDDGPGIPEDRLDDVLAGGFRLDRTVPGTGIGLAIVGDLARLHGGDLALGASALGGTKVTVSLGEAS
ncbi:MAG: HAMP domain-containing sensor histidine kinase [Hyphomicrobiaceae bacterium]|nr:HAMP domain-containing sensor histidine kinase [Hyphomicrobiaceae bacterium]